MVCNYTVVIRHDFDSEKVVNEISNEIYYEIMYLLFIVF